MDAEFNIFDVDKIILSKTQRNASAHQRALTITNEDGAIISIVLHCYDANILDQLKIVEQ